MKTRTIQIQEEKLLSFWRALRKPKNNCFLQRPSQFREAFFLQEFEMNLETSSYYSLDD